MNRRMQMKYPSVCIQTPMPEGFPRTLEYQGQTAELPGKFDHGSATHLYSLLDEEAAAALCDGEHFRPLTMETRDGRSTAVGFVAVFDYHQADIGPYREWMLALWVTPRGEPQRPLRYVNPTSHAFFGVWPPPQGYTFFAPKMIVTEPLPAEAGRELYGIPKEVGSIGFRFQHPTVSFEACTPDGIPIMSAAVPRSRGLWSQFRIGASLVQAFGPRAVAGSTLRNELPMMLAGSSKLAPKQALSISKVDRQAEFLLWDARDCHLHINANNPWGRILNELQFAPSIVSHIPNVAFVFSGPVDQIDAVGTGLRPVLSGFGSQTETSRGHA